MATPVPPDQQPLNEYQSLNDSWFFGWGKLDNLQFFRVSVIIWLGWWLVSGPVALGSFSPQRHFLKFLSAGSAGAFLGLSFILLRLFLGWSYVKDRLTSPTTPYEESGWYDGQEWQKEEPELTKDRLVASYEVEPILNKIRSAAIVLVVLLGISLGVAIS